ncbi:MAG: DDE-type integrase/transposase/recombinase [Pseudomonadales bacterium]|nr:DDE-type integrase/transposase/recombinase [Pseudomonadales bacterium]
MDIFTREIVAWQISDRHDKTLVNASLLDGLVNRDFQKPIYIHSDQGAEYCSQDYT